MKLRDIYFLCKNNYACIYRFIGRVEFSGNNKLQRELSLIKRIEDIENFDSLEEDTHIFLVDLERVYQATKRLSEIECLHFYIRDFLDEISIFPFDYVNPVKVNKKTLEKILIAREHLLFAIHCIAHLYRNMELDTKEIIGLDIKLPANHDFTEFKNNIDDLEFIFTKCPFFQHESESLKFQNVDVGSTWLTFFVVGASIVTGSILLNNVAAFIDKCLTLRSHYITIEKQKKELEHDNIDRAEKEKMISYLNRTYQKTVDTAIKELEEITNHDIEDGDERIRSVQAFERLERLLGKGLQIYSTIDSPEETKALFKPLEMKYLEINKQLRLFEDKEES